MYFEEPELIIKKPKEGFYNKLVPATSTHKNFPIDKLDIFKKDKTSKFYIQQGLIMLIQMRYHKNLALLILNNIYHQIMELNK